MTTYYYRVRWTGTDVLLFAAEHAYSSGTGAPAARRVIETLTWSDLVARHEGAGT